MIFYCIIRTKTSITNPTTYKLLQQACEERGIQFVPLESDTLNYATIYDEIVPGSLLYRLASSHRAALLEALVDDKVVTLRRDNASLLSRAFGWGSALRLERAGVAIIPTIYNVSRNHDAQLADYVKQLGGFPIVLKSTGHSHGAGVMMLNSLESLRSVLDYISDETTSNLVLRKYITNARHLRLVVLSGKVVDTIEYLPQPDDFRTNAVATPEVKQLADIDPKITADAVKAVEVLGLEFGGVDVLVDEENNFYIAEVNHPCNFARNQLNTGVDISGQMVDALLQKQATNA